MMSNLISSNGDISAKASRSREISLQYLSGAPLSKCRLYRVIVLSRSRRYKNFAEASRKVHVYQNANYSTRQWRSFFQLLVANYQSDSRWMDARVGDDRSRSRWHSAQWLFLPLLEKPFVSAYGFTALWFYHLNSASSDLFHHSPLPALCLLYSRTLSICLGLPFSLSHPSAPSCCRTRHYVTIVPWNWTSFMYRMSMTLSQREPHRT